MTEVFTSDHDDNDIAVPTNNSFDDDDEYDERN